MKIRRRRDGGLTIAIPRDELCEMILNGNLMNGDLNSRVLEITDKIHFELLRMIGAQVPVKSLLEVGQLAAIE
ncbi:MAG TPA: hypothetical protein VNZ02_16450 [Steroidobacteraceae bacterium]|jgi:hypothetical protein|nr:hypothetical protein [Steroidobacteraceae bacterium]